MCDIETTGNKIVHIKQRRIPQAMQERTKVAIDKMLNLKSSNIQTLHGATLYGQYQKKTET